MQDLSAALNRIGFPRPVDLILLAGRLGMASRPLSVSALINQLESLPTEVTLNTGPLNLSGGVPVGGWATLTLQQNGTVNFTGHFHDSGFIGYNISLAMYIKDSANVLYDVTQSCHVSGTTDSGSRDFDWNSSANNEDLANNWYNMAIGNTSNWSVKVTGDWNSVLNDLVAAAGVVVSIIPLLLGGHGGSPSPGPGGDSASLPP